MLAAFPHSPFLTGGGFGMGVILSLWWEREKKKKQEWNLLKEFPDFLQLVILALSSGLNLDQAWRVASEAIPACQLKEVLQNTPQENYFFLLERNLNDSRLSPTLHLIQESQDKGFPIQESLEIQADQLRKRTWMILEKRAQTAPLRLLFPLLLFIFPTIFLVLFGPILLQMAQFGSLG